MAEQEPGEEPKQLIPAAEPPPKEQPDSAPQQASSSVPQQASSSVPAPSTAPAAPGKLGPQEKKAREFIEQAEKKVKSAQGFWGNLFG